MTDKKTAEFVVGYSIKAKNFVEEKRKEGKNMIDEGKEMLFEKVILWGVRFFNGGSLRDLGLTFIIQLAKSIPIRVVVFLLFLPFSSIDLSVGLGMIATFACGIGLIGVLD